MWHTHGVLLKDMPLIYIKYPNQVSTIELPVTPGGEVVLGSAPTCAVPLPVEAGVAPVHARVICRPEGYVIEDLQSGYGTFQDGRPVQAEYMMPGVDYMVGAIGVCLDLQANPTEQQGETGAEETGAKPKKKSPFRKPGAAGKGAIGAKELQAMAAKYKRSGSGGATAKAIYVIVLLLVAFYAGVALRHWQRTGNYLPGIVADK